MEQSAIKQLKTLTKRMIRFDRIIVESAIRLANFNNKNWIILKKAYIELLLSDGTIMKHPTITADGVHDHIKSVTYRDIVLATVSETYWLKELNLLVTYTTRFDHEGYSTKIISMNDVGYLSSGKIVGSENDKIAFYMPPMLDYRILSTFAKYLNKRDVCWTLGYIHDFGFCIQVNNKNVIVNRYDYRHRLSFLTDIENTFFAKEMLTKVMNSGA